MEPKYERKNANNARMARKSAFFPFLIISYLIQNARACCRKKEGKNTVRMEDRTLGEKVKIKSRRKTLGIG